MSVCPTPGACGALLDWGRGLAATGYAPPPSGWCSWAQDLGTLACMLLQPRGAHQPQMPWAQKKGKSLTKNSWNRKETAREEWEEHRVRRRVGRTAECHHHAGVDGSQPAALASPRTQHVDTERCIQKHHCTRFISKCSLEHSTRWITCEAIKQVSTNETVKSCQASFLTTRL